MTTQNNDQATGQTNPTPTTAALTVQVDKTIADQVLTKIKIFEETGSLHLPKNYSAANALRIGWLMLQDTKNLENRPVLEVCTKESIANALLKMIIQGLNPAKRQCSFIAYANILTCQREYAGAIAIARRVAGVKDIKANAVFKGDKFAYLIDPKTMIKTVTMHEQTLESIDEGTVIGAYAVKEYLDGHKEAEIMSMNQIRKAWEMGKAKGQSPAHKNFPDQMAEKTVINRALKIDINSSDDSDVMPEEVDEEMIPLDDDRTAGVKQQIENNANQQDLTITVDETPTTTVETTEGTVDISTGQITKEPVKQGRPF